MEMKSPILTGIEHWISSQHIVGIVAVDTDLNIQFINDWIKTNCQLNAIDVLGKNILEVFPDLNQHGVLDYMDSAVSGQTAVLSNRFHKYILPVPLADAMYEGIEFMQQSTTISPLLSRGMVEGVIIVIEDVTDRVVKELELKQQIKELKAIQNSLIQSERSLKESNLEKDKFLSILAHDLRAPMHGILGFARLLTSNYDSLSGEKIQEYAVMIEKSGTNLYTLLENLLEWAKVKNGLTVYTPENIIPSEIVNEVILSINEISNQKGITITHSVPPDLQIVADKNMLRSVLRNLATNALKFTPSGGNITFGAVETEKQKVKFSVSDSGIGMNDELIENLFRMDKDVGRTGTDGEPSTGLGLILCKEFIDKHQGVIEVESEINKGTTILFSI